jgi:hypothetical protein
MEAKGPAIRKRTQIAIANRVMFLWVAGISVVFGISLVVAIFLIQMLLFNERVLSVKNQTVATLKTDNNNITNLKNQISVLNTNQALINSETAADAEPIQVILDALPSDANSLALGASLQNKLLSGINGLVLNSLQPIPVTGVESLNGNGSNVNNSTGLSATQTSQSQNEITFTFSVTGSTAALKQVLLNLEKSIRTINVTSLEIQSQGTGSVMTVSACAYYEPARVVQLTDEVVK